MIRSLMAGVAGLKSQQIRMDVIANNIANVNTTSFKSGRVLFTELLSQNIRGNSTSQIGVNSINPAQVGLGVTVSAIDCLFGQGSLMATNRVLDLTVDGNGLFVLASFDPNDVQGGVVSDGAVPTKNFYTRDGAFYVNEAGYLVNSSGLYVLGNSQDIAPDLAAFDDTARAPIRLYDPTTHGLETIRITSDGGIWVTVYDDTGTRSSGYIGTIGLDNYPNPENLIKLGFNLLEVPVDDQNVPTSTGWGAPESGGRGKALSGNLEMSNVDLSTEFSNMIITQRGYQASARVITVSDDMLRELIDIKR
ncbi:MAG: flagellar hook-basal body complex protein [Bacillota bacterium]|uniref:flagellar hook-basal body protein n=1 Tax=Desulforudis sp. DRI-14 TaxID=3459793 RepID=UPI00347E0EF4